MENREEEKEWEQEWVEEEEEEEKCENISNGIYANLWNLFGLKFDKAAVTAIGLQCDSGRLGLGWIIYKYSETQTESMQYS